MCIDLSMSNEALNHKIEILLDEVEESIEDAKNKADYQKFEQMTLVHSYLKLANQKAIPQGQG